MYCVACEAAATTLSFENPYWQLSHFVCLSSRIKLLLGQALTLAGQIDGSSDSSYELDSDLA
jgi:hypothetical protein